MKNKIIILLIILVIALGGTCVFLLVNNKKDVSVSQKEEKKQEQEEAPIKITEEKYVAKDDEYSVLILKSDNTFDMDVNLCEGIGNYKGTYTKTDKKFILSIEKINFGGFSGDDYEKITFNILENGKIKLNDQISCTWEGLVFYKK